MMSYAFNLILFSAIFWLIYQLLLKKETFFTANRIYLLAAPILGLVLPLLSFEFFQFGSTEGFVFHLPIAELGELNQTTPANPSSETAQTAAHSFSLVQILIGVYSLGVLVGLGLFLRKIRRLQQLKSTGKILYRENVDIISLPNSLAAFSFFNSIFLGENHSEKEKVQILAHENVHVREKHSWDLLYFEALRILLWFNPFVYLFQKNTAEVHEFLADRKVTKTTSKKTYAQNLLNAGFGTRQLSFTNSFFTENSLKTRLLMLYKKSSTRSSKLKFLVVVPLVFLMLTYVACSKDDLKPQEKAIKDSNAVELIPSTEIDVITAKHDSPMTIEEIPQGYITKVDGISKVVDKNGDPVHFRISSGKTVEIQTLGHFIIKTIDSEIESVKGQIIKGNEIGE